MNASLKTLKRRFIRCSAQATITHVKKFIAKKVLSGMEKYRDVSILTVVIICRVAFDGIRFISTNLDALLICFFYF